MAVNGWGLIGTGRIADDRVLPGINAVAGNKLIGVVSRTQERADTFAKKFNAQHAYTRYEDLLANPDVTVVAIHTPNAQHADQAIAAARAGKHVFCDKPMATNTADAERMVRECEKAGVKLGINFHNRFMPCFMDTKKIVESGEIGEVKLVQIEVSPGFRPGGRLGQWRVDPSIAGLGTTYSIGVHAFDILRYMLGAEVITVTALFDSPKGKTEEQNISVVRFDNGAIGQLSVHENVPFPHNDFVIYGTKGRILGRGLTRSRAGGELQVSIAGGETRSTEYAAGNAHGACVKAFSEALLAGKDFVPSGIDGLRSVQLTDAMARSAWDGVHVRLAG